MTPQRAEKTGETGNGAINAVLITWGPRSCDLAPDFLQGVGLEAQWRQAFRMSAGEGWGLWNHQGGSHCVLHSERDGSRALWLRCGVQGSRIAVDRQGLDLR